MTHPDLINRFIAKWGPGGAGFGLNEEQGAQQHFIEEADEDGYVVTAPSHGIVTYADPHR